MRSFTPSLSFLLSFFLLPLLHPQVGPVRFSNFDGLIQPAVNLGLGLQFAHAAELQSSLIKRDNDATPAAAYHHSTRGTVNLDLEDTGASTSGGHSHVAPPPLRRRHAALQHARAALNHTNDGNDGKRSLYLGRRAAGAQFTNFVTGLGACGGFNNPSDYVVALNTEQWDNGAHCNAHITITIGGKSVQAQIVDRCEKCGYNNLDFTDGLFEVWANLGVGTLQGEWEYGNGAPPKPVPMPSPTHHSSTTTASTTSSVASSSGSSSTSVSATASTTSNAKAPAAPSQPAYQPGNIELLYLSTIGMSGILLATLNSTTGAA